MEGTSLTYLGESVVDVELEKGIPETLKDYSFHFHLVHKTGLLMPLLKCY